MKTVGLILILFSFLPVVSSANDRLAHELFAQSRYAEAAELFTDPQWKGVALYRSEQWIRAAEAFAKSDDPFARYNLANCYAKLGHYALALQTYQQVLKRFPDFEDAAFNAELLQALMTNKDEEKKGQAQNQESDKQQPSEAEKKPGAGNDSGQDKQQQSQKLTPPEDQQAGAMSQPAGSDTPSAGQKGLDNHAPLSQLKDGEKDEHSRAKMPQSAPASSGKHSDSNEADASRFMSAEQEKKQQQEQWLSTIEDKPSRFLKARIELEIRRRAEAGTLAQPGTTPW